MGLFFYAAPIDTTLKATICNGFEDGAFVGDAQNISYVGAIHGRVYRCAPNLNDLGLASVSWSGCKNFPIASNNRTFICRFKPVYEGFPGAVTCLFSVQGAGMYPKVNSFVLHHWVDGHLRISGFSGNSASSEQTQITSSPISLTKHQSYDLVVTWDSSTNFSVYLDGVKIVDNFNVGFNFLSVTQDAIIGTISIGYGGLFIQAGGFLIEEFAIYDEMLDGSTITSTYVGAARTTPIATTPSRISWPAIGDVASTATWKEPTGTKTGTLIVAACDYPDEDQVQDGVEYANGTKTGTFGRHIPQTNQYFAPLEVQAEIFAVLNADADLTTLIGANKVFDFVPDKTAFPYITVNALPFTQRDNATNDGMECEFQINVWYQPGKSGTTSRGNKPVQLIQKRIDELLQHRSLCVNGWNTLQLRRTFIDILVESDNVTRHGVQRFNLFLGSKD